MKPQHVTAALSNEPRRQSASVDPAKPQSRPRLSSSALDNFWMRMSALFGHTWASQYGVSPEGAAGDTWAAALAGLTPEQVADGLRETLVLGSDFPPSAPKFRALCYGIPAWATVKREMRPGFPEPSPFARAMWGLIDGWEYQRATVERAERMAHDAYEAVRDRVMRGEPLPDQPTAFIEAPVPQPRTPASDETVKANMEAIEEMLAAKQVFREDSAA